MKYLKKKLKLSQKIAPIQQLKLFSCEIFIWFHIYVNPVLLKQIFNYPSKKFYLSVAV